MDGVPFSSILRVNFIWYQLRSWDYDAGDPSCVMLSPPAPTHNMIMTGASDLDWEYIQISKQFRPHFVPNGFGQAELVLLVYVDAFTLLRHRLMATLLSRMYTSRRL